MSHDEFLNLLLTSETEEEVTKVLIASGFNDYADEHWIPYGGKQFENNFGIVGNQQSDAIGALVEKIVNSIDAVLMRECLSRGIDPKSSQAPTSMSEAAALFFNVPGGNLAKIGADKRAEIANNNISVIMTGNKPKEGSGNPCLIVLDKGEGQEPEKFKDTLLSLLKNNKMSVHFVQGKFNMGSTGSLVYCSEEKNYQLIASRRNPACGSNSNAKWGFTLIRKRPPLANERSSRYEYLAPNGVIPTLEATSIKVIPEKNRPYKLPLEYGTIVKMYEYNLPKGVSTMATTDFYRALSGKLWNVVVPFRIYETRDYKGHTLESTFSGMNIRLEDDQGSVLEPGFPCNFSINVEGIGELNGRICLFKKDAETKRWINSKEAVVYTVNGQAHGALPNDFFRRDSVGLPWIQKDLLVNIDCTKIDHTLFNKIFMPSRDRQRDVHEKNLIEKALAEFLKSHHGLREWNDRRHREVIEKKLGSDDQTIELFEKMVHQNPHLAEILGFGSRVKVSIPGKKEVEKYIGQRHPSFLKIEGISENVTPEKKCPVNSYIRVVFLTDVENDYLDRAIDPGELVITPSGIVKSKGLYNGRTEIQFQPKLAGITQVGVKTRIEVKLSSPIPVEGFYSAEFDLLTIPPISSETHPPTPPKPPKSSMANMPDMIEVFTHDWDSSKEIDSEEDLVNVIKDPNSITSFINMDNKYYRRYTATYPKRALEIKNLYKISATIIGVWLLEQLEKNAITEEGRRVLGKSIGRILLPLIDSLGGKLAELQKV